MIVFQPIGYRDYKKHFESKLKKIPHELIERGDFKIYFNDDEAHRVAELESGRNKEWDYIGYVIQYCLQDEYIKRLKKLNNIDESLWWITKPLTVPIGDTVNINIAMIHSACEVGFYYNKANKFSKAPMPIEEIRKMQILQHYSNWDPEGLIEMCAPRDEYYHEIHEIWNRVDKNTSTEELATIIEEVTEKVFGNKYFRKGTNILEIAKKIDLLIK